MKSLRIVKWSVGIFEPIARRPMWNVSLGQTLNIKKYLGKGKHIKVDNPGHMDPYTFCLNKTPDSVIIIL